MFEFQSFWTVLLLPLPYLVWRYIKPAQVQTTTIYMSFITAYKSVAGKQKSKKYLLFACALWILLILATMRPVYVGAQQNIDQPARDLMLAIDISGSMEKQDMFMPNGTLINRLQTVKIVMNDFIERRKGDRIGLILFGDEAYLQSPLTLDIVATNQLLQEAEIGLAGKNTAIGDAIGLAVKKLTEQKNKNAVILLLTDGADTASSISPQQATTIARKAGIKIYTIGIVPEVSNQWPILGQTSDIDEQLLRTMAKQTNGQYFHASNREQLELIYQTIDSLEQVKTARRTVRPEKQLYYYPLALAFLLVIGYLLLLVLRRTSKS